MRTRPATFAADASSALEQLGFPCRVAASTVGTAGDGGAGSDDDCFGMYAVRTIRGGEPIVVERPFAMTISQGARHQRCAVCLKDSRSRGSHAWSMLCPGCSRVRFCSTSCAAVAEASFHPRGGIECVALNAVQDDSALTFDTADTTMQAIRILALRAAGTPVQVVGGRSFGSDVARGLRVGYDAYETRLSHSCAPSSREVTARIRTAAAIALRAVPSAARVSPVELRALLERHASNLFGLNGPGGLDIASASFVGFAHLFNHSCAPNAVLDVDGRWMDDATQAMPSFALVALRAIERGEQV